MHVQASRMLLLLGDKIIDRERAAKLTAASADGAELALPELPLFAVHGCPSTGPVSTCLVLDGLVEALRLVDSPPAAAAEVLAEVTRDHPRSTAAEILAEVGATNGSLGDATLAVAELGRSPAMMDFDVVALMAAPPHTLHAAGAFAATQQTFTQHLGQFAGSELERVQAFVHEAALADSRKGRRARATERRALGRTADPGDSDVARASAPLALLTQLQQLSYHDWHALLPFRWLLIERMGVASPAEVAEAVRAAEQCFAERLALTEAEYLAAEIAHARWLLAAGKSARVLEILNCRHRVPAAVLAEPSAAERCFLAGMAWRRLDEPRAMEAASTWLTTAARLGHRGAQRRLRAPARAPRESSAHAVSDLVTRET